MFLIQQNIFLGAGTIQVHDDVSPGEPRTRAFRFKAECSADGVTDAKIIHENLKYFKKSRALVLLAIYSKIQPEKCFVESTKI